MAVAHLLGERPAVKREIAKLLCHTSSLDSLEDPTAARRDESSSEGADIGAESVDSAGLAGFMADAATTAAVLAMQQAEAAAGGASSTGPSAVICKCLADAQSHLLAQAAVPHWH